MLLFMNSLLNTTYIVKIFQPHTKRNIYSFLMVCNWANEIVISAQNGIFKCYGWVFRVAFGTTIICIYKNCKIENTSLGYSYELNLIVHFFIPLNVTKAFLRFRELSALSQFNHVICYVINKAGTYIEIYFGYITFMALYMHI